MSTAFNMALGTGVLVGFSALSVDLGFANFSRTQVQAAADAASIAGAISLAEGETDADMVESARTWGQANSVGTLSVVVDETDVVRGTYDADAGTFVQDDEGIDVRARAHTVGSPAFLSRIFGNADLDTQAISISRVMPGAVCTVVGTGKASAHGTPDLIGYDSEVDLDPEFAFDEEAAMCSNSSINMNGGPFVDGNVRPGIGGTVSGGTVTGSTAPLSSVLEYDAAALPAGITNWPHGYSLNSRTPVNVTPGDYRLTGSLRTNGQAQINISGPTNLYVVNQDVTINGGGFVNSTLDPHNLAIYVTGNQQIRINGNADFYGYVYAPDSEVDVTGTADFYGAIIAEDVDIGGTGLVYMDTSLIEETVPGGIQLVR
ncbi:MAG: hypothetical protein H0V89_12160 [Deltaproteobacteria bacterium]|nr:hypothetical protein [Deltaproteobacteria bacterium]